jgi:hypothetical protein
LKVFYFHLMIKLVGSANNRLANDLQKSTKTPIGTKFLKRLSRRFSCYLRGENQMTDDQDEDRRKFLATCGRFAAVTPPVITVLLSTSLTSNAVAGSMGHGGYGDGRGDHAYGNGHGDYGHGDDNRGHNNQGHKDSRGWIRRGDRDD